MKKTFTINISGTVFHIEDDAYEKLQNYILKLKQHFGTGEEGNEIISDIESRIAELFLKKTDGGNGVIIMPWVDEVIEIMGTPEAIIEEGQEESESTSAKRKRRLYRDPDKRIIGGVCGGLGAYLNMDPVILRIIFVVLFLINGIGLIAYLILWIAVPKAVNTAQRLEMKGQEVTVSNIEKSIKEEAKEIKDTYKKFKESGGVEKARQGASQFGDEVRDVFRVIFKICGIVIGVILILSGFFGLLGFISSLIIGHSFVSSWPLIWTPELHMPGVLNQLVSPGTVTTGLIMIGFLIGIPLLAMLFIGTKMVFRYKSNNTLISLGMVGVWVVALIGIMIIFAGQIGNFKSQTSLSNSETVECNACQTLYLDVAPDKWDNFKEHNWNIDKFDVVLINGKERLVGEPRLNVEKSSTDVFSVIVKKSSRGKSISDAKENIQDVVYNFNLKDSSLVFDPNFLISEDGTWRDQKVNITVKVPEGKTIFLSKNMDKIIFDIDNVSNTWDGDMVGKYWEMKPEGLVEKELKAGKSK
jgi:phage shock protein PspC (stress-responsive transcriptional regulator)